MSEPYMLRGIIAALLLVLGSIVLYALLSRKLRTKLPLPPSLKGHFLFGHLFMLPSSDQHVVYRDISNQLNSDIISFTVPGQVIVVLNSIGSVMDLISKRGAIYSDRPELPMLNDERLAGWGRITGCLPYGERWKKQRAMTQAVLHPTAGEELWPKMVKQTRLSMQRLLKSPESVATEIRWMSAAVLLSSVYGYEASHPHDQLVQSVEAAADQFCEAAIPINFFVNTIPWLIHVPSWFPGASWKRKANEWRVGTKRLINEPFEWTRSQMAANTALPSISKTLLTNLATNEIPKHGIESEEDMIRWVTGTLYIAGADTTVATETIFVLAMILYPEVQKKAQAELDAVLGDRLPELSDRKALPYLNAVMKEVMRWRSVAPMGLPHVTTKDDIYKGFFIPKGAIILINIWAIGNNPHTYSNPEEFNPERFMDRNLPPAPVFGVGRRECPGAYFAESSFFLMASTFLTIFEANPMPGKPLPETKLSSNVAVSHPKPFDCIVAPRSESRRRLIEQWVEL